MSVRTPDPATLLGTALTAGTPPDDQASTRILDAALVLIADEDPRALTMDSVAERANVGRMTVYRRFGDRARLLQALAVREAQRALGRVEAAIDDEAPVADQVAAGFVAALREARTHPLLTVYAARRPEEFLAALNDQSAGFMDLLRTFVAARLRMSDDTAHLDPAELETAAELLVRIGTSFVLIPRSVLDYDNDRAARAVAQALITPIVTGSSA